MEDSDLRLSPVKADPLLPHRQVTETPSWIMHRHLASSALVQSYVKLLRQLGKPHHKTDKEEMVLTLRE
eukprot:scaffold25455_cov152-Cylindrotheca_fusiformis.AAC.3